MKKISLFISVFMIGCVTGALFTYKGLKESEKVEKFDCPPCSAQKEVLIQNEIVKTSENILNETEIKEDKEYKENKEYKKDQENKGNKDETMSQASPDKPNMEMRLLIPKETQVKLSEASQKELSETLLQYPKDVWVHSEVYKNMSSDFKKIQGRYQGKLSIPSLKNEVHDMVMDINYQQLSKEDGGEVGGTFSLQIIRDGSVYSDSNGSGSNNNIRLIREKNPKIKGIIIDATSEDFIHFYSIGPDGDSLKGNYYKSGKWFGFVTMSKH